eukprot:UC4_evm3s622
MAVTRNVTQIANEGIILERHYVHWHCSPTRRSFLSGRLPLHHGEELSAVDTDDLDLRWNLISQKLKPKGYKSYWYGKGHTGFKSVAHLPTSRGFDDFVGFLSGAQSYYASDRWANEVCYNNTEYSSDLYGEAAVNALRNHDATVPFFMYLPWQAVHGPYDLPPGWNVDEDGPVYYGMLKGSDMYMGQIYSLLKSKSMWRDTLFIYSSDNGGVDYGLNYPLRGEKHTNWDGGLRVAAFVSGGLIPESLRGTSSDILFHIVDWYPTICFLAGVDPSDDSPIAPLNPDPNSHKDIYNGNESWPGIDGVNIWPFLTNPQEHNFSSAHSKLWISKEVLIVGKLKLLVAQPDPAIMSSKSVNNGWKSISNDWNNTGADGWGCSKYRDRTNFKPCLFNLLDDESERIDLSDAQPDVVKTLWEELNYTQLTSYFARSPASLLGNCDEKCAMKKYGGCSHPTCGVPGSF